MSVRTGTCDFCADENDGLLDTGDDTSVAFYANNVYVLWDGVCRQGSSVYFNELSGEDLVYNIKLSEKILTDDPLRFAEPFDSPEVHQRKLWIQDEVFRAKREIVYRVEEA